MQIADLDQIRGKRFPARRWTRGLVGTGLPIEATHFATGYVVLEPKGGQVPWHNQEQEEVYFLIQGTCEMCLGEERQLLKGGQAVYIPPEVYHQLTNVGDEPAIMLYIFSPVRYVAHPDQELSGTLPRAGVDVPPLPEGARPQCVSRP